MFSLQFLQSKLFKWIAFILLVGFVMSDYYKFPNKVQPKIDKKELKEVIEKSRLIIKSKQEEELEKNNQKSKNIKTILNQTITNKYLQNTR